MNFSENEQSDIDELTIVQQESYMSMRCNNVSHKTAIMLAARQSPSVATPNKSFWRGRVGNQFAKDPRSGHFYESVAKTHGVSTTGRIYEGQLARFPGDPQAWIDGPDDAKAVCKKNGWSVTGIANYKAPELDPAPLPSRPFVADDILNKAVRREIEKDPGKAANLAKTREEVREKITPTYGDE